MHIAPKPFDEEQRLSDLLSYDVLDTEAEALFDELTQLASQICGTPIALVSLIDSDRQWFKSKVGINETETSRNVAFCAHAILQDEVFEVADASKDPRFKDNPLVEKSPNIRFYAGAPLITPNGHAIGTLCALSSKPKTLTCTQKQALKTLSRAVISQLELRKKNQELRRINHFRSEFLSYISHEIRTPMNAINTFSRLLKKEAKATNLPEFFSESLTHIVKSGDRLLEIVNSVLDIQQLETGKLTLLPRVITSKDFFVHLFTLMNVRAEDENVTFQWHIDDSLPPVMKLDDTKFGQIVLNILSNAIKYTPATKNVICQIFYAQEQLVLVVKDEGIGISEEEQQRLFSPYHRTDDAKKFEGTGLGLAITKGLVDLMEGQITVKSHAGSGSTFKISIPVAPPTAQDIADAQAPASDVKLAIKANPAITDKTKLLADGLDAVLTKPVEVGALIHILNQYLSEDKK
ncbi:GAF domain-containing sensor histidine kinase [Alteromonas pelagimontana]|uniref:histidine kinase n=1 Tax=Alteromonas pelagimontana TaxID=1858656 RepID=A0A6M4MBK8_9ALTE|nr:GAF domain-containing sensor histidine kinase [Alteromonas pelagimontana]QJR79990.1 GAF domain-containing sensor histidine kinase [Alteromonas pelagimontana]